MSGQAVTVVTDSTAYLPDGMAERLGILVVPLHVRLADRAFQEGVDLSSAEFVDWIARPGNIAMTSQPTGADISAAYAAAPGAVVSVHMSSALSGTCGAAQLAGERAGKPVRVVDSRNVAMGLGFAVMAAAEAASRGAGLAEVAEAAERAAARSRTLFYVDSLEHLRRGGRIGTARSLLGGVLSVKPLLHILDGEIAMLERIRTSAKALARLEDVAALTAGHAEVDLAVQHLGAADRAAAVADRLTTRIPRVHSVHLSELGPVVGAHVGAGTVGVVVHQR
ncbi:MAG: DegV family protein [Mycobacteriales bacterium]